MPQIASSACKPHTTKRRDSRPAPQPLNSHSQMPGKGESAARLDMLSRFQWKHRIAQLVMTDHDRRVLRAQHKTAHVSQPLPKVVGIVSQLLNLLDPPVRAILAPEHPNSTHDLLNSWGRHAAGIAMARPYPSHALNQCPALTINPIMRAH